jgi:hypothetical protein
MLVNMCGFVLFTFKILTIISYFESLLKLFTNKQWLVYQQWRALQFRKRYVRGIRHDLTDRCARMPHRCHHRRDGTPLNFCRIKLTFRDDNYHSSHKLSEWQQHTESKDSCHTCAQRFVWEHTYIYNAHGGTNNNHRIRSLLSALLPELRNLLQHEVVTMATSSYATP